MIRKLREILNDTLLLYAALVVFALAVAFIWGESARNFIEVEHGVTTSYRFIPFD